jgi:Ni,Fe-hydrogenase I cytochrome b subunit
MLSVGFICFVVFIITTGLVFYDETVRYALLKGYFCYFGVKWTIKMYAKIQELYHIWRKHSTHDSDS